MKITEKKKIKITPKKKIIIAVSGGAVSVLKNPDNITIEIRDYDTDGDFGTIKEDKDGDKYQEILTK